VAEPTTIEVLAFALELAEEADELTMGYFGGEAGVRAKADGSLVTLADTEAEAMLRRRINERYADHTIEGEEEETAQGAAGAPRWILDPIDGTHNFTRGVEVWATLIAFERDGVIEVGVASAPAMRTRWWAARGSGAFRGPLPATTGPGERMRVSERSEPSELSVVYASYPRTMDEWSDGVDTLLRAAWRTRGFGDFWGHMVVAEGKAEVMLDPVAEPYDLAALVPIVEEAGGRLTDIDGTATIDGGQAITSNGFAHEYVLATLVGQG
jgi:histidinol-phosphatase